MFEGLKQLTSYKLALRGRDDLEHETYTPEKSVETIHKSQDNKEETFQTVNDVPFASPTVAASKTLSSPQTQQEMRKKIIAPPQRQTLGKGAKERKVPSTRISRLSSFAGITSIQLVR